MKRNEITFSFGANWQRYVRTVGEEEIESAKRDIEEWLGQSYVKGKTVLDVGSGSGLCSLAFHRLGAKLIYSFDFDQKSVLATRVLREREGAPDNWIVSSGSILDKQYVASLVLRGGFDIVYAWGVLHHTGSMWEALDNCMSIVKPGGKLWISLYAKGPRYAQDFALKRKYNSASTPRKRWMVYSWICEIMLHRLRELKNPLAWNEKKSRGMNVYHDIVDWLGGMPYEVAGEDEVLSAMANKGLTLERKRILGDGGCSIYVFVLPWGR